MMRNLQMHHRIGLVLIVILGLSAASLADIIILSDGRQFEGQVVAEKDDVVQFDTVISGIRAKLSFKRSEVTSLEKKPLADDFFDEAESYASQRDEEAKKETLYLEIPIVGRFKEQVFDRAVRLTLAYAKRQEIPHIVFTVDSSGGAVDEAILLYRRLKQYSDAMSYHAIVRNCTGEALVIPFLCDTVYLVPGGKIGGSDQRLQDAPRQWAKKAESVVRKQIAENLEAEAQRRGRKGQIIKAMFDPTEEIAAWEASDGEIVMGRTPPEDLPPDQLIFKNGPDRVLVLSFEQAKRLGIPVIEGGKEELDEMLGLGNWREESDRGRSDMNKAIAYHRKRATQKQAKYEDDLVRNVRMRETTKQAIEYNLKQAATWNPTDASYRTISRYLDVGWDPAATFDMQVWTPESRRRWRSRTEACGYYLERALEGIEAMINLDREAVRLGLSPTYRDNELVFMQDDVKTKLTILSRHRYRVGE
jgi:hypothetical protein